MTEKQRDMESQITKVKSKVVGFTSTRMGNRNSRVILKMIIQLEQSYAIMIMVRFVIFAMPMIEAN